MKNLYDEKAAARLVRRYARQGIGADLAQRIYTSRLLGGDPALVRHGGGNTSLKAPACDAAGRIIDALYIKGSGCELGELDVAGLPALDLGQLTALGRRRGLNDTQMVRVLRAACLDADAPDPSVETLLHAFLPHKFIDHTHADAVLALSNQPNGARLCRQVFGARVIVAPYAMSGFRLAKEAARLARAHPEAQALIVLKHGVFSFGATAREAYGRMIRLVSAAERRLRKGPGTEKKRAPQARSIDAASLAPILRGAVAETVGDGDHRRVIAEFRSGPKIRAFVDTPALARLAAKGPATPDHVIWTKPRPLVLPCIGRHGDAAGIVTKAVAAYAKDYQGYVARHRRRRGGITAPLDPYPRIALAPGLGFFGLGASAREAAIAADLFETNIKIITDAARIGRYAPAAEGDQFDIEYWPPEQAKRLTRGPPPPLAGQVALITGGGSGIGAATARLFAAHGAAVAVLDLDAVAAGEVAAETGGLGLGCDVTEPKGIRRAFDAICRAFGGVDIAVSNAGAAWQGEIGTVDDAVLRQSFELNFFAHQSIAQHAVRVMRAQRTGGCLLFNTSKQAVNPGADFGPYGLPKAATLFLTRQYAVDHGRDGIRTGAVNADRIRSGLLTDKMITQRAKARGLSQGDYMSGNLLGREVTAEDVARAFLDLALARASTGAVITVDGGNIAATLR
ncbi:MAG: bifunctional aldolase/short-chain dehydrogenase [Rhodospirillales bacterium]|jgi:rhamnose utilization protein RhaD (predicted bifunctional aldolase and dehydrogenase)/NAD(P)-dependent dehydrogenase (short-subunit alcohol dehydrogenase family)|nr:bifunctional aldolase/short-chain dehydrogenase [Rhodospirillales bacterium]MDP6646276.1 bifunctional aldolase/short-chain dehydrogenase [Rhodospirillales bacterium]